ncbi:MULTISPECIES: inner membrane protein YpjD [unclassified Oceanobacter]|uniref:cytochrome C assembly family protein n=1 Tax=unclassified Oceanobacter TaxID=2620260 RepID=UPI0026E3361C|nr:MULTISPECIES: cytochrome c biogenesis protein CcsA [unclassified Oceanobacter]MDO6682080.1 cytochrome c biogenesis protein CcsA [Oceanobacter sp. 5_MG-2023]MDP2505525.1 cytochrome c biogenesis protein CcsA [Oceanobacter sp. 3_MG-2023]MDP2547100.1 cytochrome c biogenesis protein CcsA [Oceanobacter sp. 4_MG-2023]MDP2609725.1 cytochrome c biogenesis protein CcsA [Oceanobacter sp. 1_MG-2023]MDP2613056.1 cytochrome c biogenesis protein CcsA [Oceanobacter sp. 2_MG-2023]
MSEFFVALPAAALYLFSAFRQWQTIRGDRPANRNMVLTLAMLASLTHMGVLVFSAATNSSDQSGINFAFYDIGSVIGLLITLLLLFSSLKKPVENLFVGLFPMIVIVLLVSSLSQRHESLQHLSYGLVWHIMLSMLAYSVFVIAAVQSILLSLQDRHLRKHKTHGLIQALPPLQTMDVLLFEMIWLGMILLTMAFAIGWPSVVDLKEQHLIHKVAFASIGWSVFALLLFGRYRFGWRGVTASRWTLIGTGFLVLSYFGSKFVLEVLIDR